jgi:hypothetical protein
MERPSRTQRAEMRGEWRWAWRTGWGIARDDDGVLAVWRAHPALAES